MVARPSKGNPTHRLRSAGLPLAAYDELIRYSREYLEMTNASRSTERPVDRIAEITYLVLRLSKGNVRLRLGALARKLGIGSRVLTKRFRQLYGTTPKESQIRIRVEWACDAIQTFPDRKIGSIAADSGYSDVADFNHVFRKYTGMSPKQYQKDCRAARDRAHLAEPML